jgi:hypothetical protein
MSAEGETPPLRVWTRWFSLPSEVLAYRRIGHPWWHALLNGWYSVRKGTHG